jgi:hypothetical protein
MSNVEGVRRQPPRQCRQARPANQPLQFVFDLDVDELGAIDGNEGFRRINNGEVGVDGDGEEDGDQGVDGGDSRSDDGSDYDGDSETDDEDEDISEAGLDSDLFLKENLSLNEWKLSGIWDVDSIRSFTKWREYLEFVIGDVNQLVPCHAGNCSNDGLNFKQAFAYRGRFNVAPVLQQGCLTLSVPRTQAIQFFQGLYRGPRCSSVALRGW